MKQLGSAKAQSGAVLVIVLVMVGIFMIIVTSLVASSSINFKIAGNQQYRLEAKTAAKNAIEDYLSNPANFSLPLPVGDVVYDFNFNGAVDANGNAITDMSASVAPPVCAKADPIGINELDADNADDVQCLGSPRMNAGIIGSAGPTGNADSWCSRMNWDVAATVADDATGAEIQMNQGVFTRAVIGTPCPI